MGYFINGVFKKDRRFSRSMMSFPLLGVLALFSLMSLLACDQPVGAGGAGTPGATPSGSTSTTTAGTTTPTSTTPTDPANPNTPTPTDPAAPVPDPLPGPNDIELLGYSLLAAPDSKGEMEELELTVTNESMVFDGFEASIVSFDNAADTAILKVNRWDTNTPALGKFLRSTWQDAGSPGSGHWTFKHSSFYNSAQEAQAAPEADIIQSGSICRRNGTLSAPTGLAVTSIDGQSISLSWNPVAGASEYRILFLVVGKMTTYRSRDDSPGTTRTIWVPGPGEHLVAVRAVDSDGHAGFRSTGVSAIAQLDPPNLIWLGSAAAADGAASLNLAWSVPQKSSTGFTYDLYRSTSENGSYAKIAATASKSFNVGGLALGTEHWFYLVSHSPDGFYSGPSAKYRFTTLTETEGGILVGLE